MNDKPIIGYLEQISRFPIKTNVVSFNFKNLLDSQKPNKFIQFFTNNEHYIRIGGLDHRQILKQTLEEFNLKYNLTKNEVGHEIPTAQGENYQLLGAGKIRLEDKFFSFCSESREYGLTANKSALMEVSKKVPMKIFESVEYFEPYLLVRM